jgi:arsenate reductase
VQHLAQGARAAARAWRRAHHRRIPQDPAQRGQLKAIARASFQPLRALLRTKQPEYLEQRLDDPDLSDDQLAAAMHATPVLIERPIVVTAKGARLGRPVENILEVLD